MAKSKLFHSWYWGVAFRTQERFVRTAVSLRALVLIAKLAQQTTEGVRVGRQRESGRTT